MQTKIQTETYYKRITRTTTSLSILSDSSQTIDIQQEIMIYLLNHGAKYTALSSTLYSPTVVHLAARKGCVKFIQILVDWLRIYLRNDVYYERELLNLIKLGKRTAIHQAFASGKKEIIELFEQLLKRDVYLSICQEQDYLNNETCLHLACKKGNYESIQRLLNYNSMVCFKMINTLNKIDKYPLDLFIESITHRKESENDQVLELSDKLRPKQLINVDDSNLLPKSIELCVRFGYLKLFKKLLDSNYEKISLKKLYSMLNTLQETIFHVASQNNQIDILNYLFNEIKKDEEQFNRDLLRRILISTTPVPSSTMMMVTSDDKSALDCAISCESMEASELLLNELKLLGDMNIYTLKKPLILCLQRDLSDILKLLIQISEIDTRLLLNFDISSEQLLKYESLTDNTLLHLCAEYNSIQCFQLITQLCACDDVYECFLKKNSDDLIPFNIAILNDNYDIFELFIYFCENNNRENVTYNISKIIELTNDQLYRSIHFAAKNEDKRFLDKLLDYHPNLKAKTLHNRHCVDIMCKIGNDKCLESILKYIKDIDVSINLQSSIKLAIQNHQHDIVELLLKYELNNQSFNKLINAKYYPDILEEDVDEAEGIFKVSLTSIYV